MVAAALVLTAACGSTVQIRGTAGDGTGQVGDTSGLGAPTGGLTSSAPGVTAPGSGSVPTGSGGSTAVPSGPVGAATQGPAAGGGPAGPAALTQGFGFTRTEIRIGVAYDSTFSQELGAVGVGAGSASVGDQKLQVEALVNDLNKRGGILHRKVVPVFYDTKGASSENNPNVLAQAACSYWTQDNQVWAALTYVVQMDNRALYTCLAQKHVVFMPLAGEAAATFAKYSPYLWSPAGVTPEQIAPLWAARLKALSYFSGWDTRLGRAGTAKPVIGMLYGNGVRNNQKELDDSFRAAVKSALGRYGYQVTTEAEITANQASESSAVLRFSNAHVTHVIGDYSVVNFTQSAESQGYRPRYALSSFSGGVAMKLFAPPSQLRGAVGIGWVPSGDVESDRDPGTAGQAHCRKVMQDAHQSTTVRLAWFAMTWACDSFSFLEHALPLTGLDSARLPAAAASVGRLSGAFTFAMEFPHGQPYGVALARDYAWDTGCSCFVYTSRTDHAL